MALGKGKNKIKLPDGVEPQGDVLDVDGMIAEMEDYTGLDIDGNGTVGSFSSGGGGGLQQNSLQQNSLSELEDFLSDDSDEGGADSEGDLEDDLFAGEDDSSFDPEEYNNQSFQEGSDDEEGSGPREQSGEDYLKNFMISDDELESDVTLSDYNIQEDIILADDKKTFPYKTALIIFFGALLCFVSIIVIIFFNNYNLVPEKVKHSTYTWGNYSVIPRDYMVKMADIKYGDNIMYIENPGDIIPKYRYALIIDTKLKTPRAINIFDTQTGLETAISIEDIAYIIDTDINKGVTPPQADETVTVEGADEDESEAEESDVESETEEDETTTDEVAE